MFTFLNSGLRRLTKILKRNFTREGFRFSFAQIYDTQINLKCFQPFDNQTSFLFKQSPPQDYAVDTATLKVDFVFESLKAESQEQTLIVIGFLLLLFAIIPLILSENKHKDQLPVITLHFRITGSDTIVTHNGRIYEKPADTEDAVRLNIN